MSDETQRAVYSSPEVAKLLQVKESTLRKYCLVLMEEGYEFLKDALGHRAFTDADVITLRKLLELKDSTSMTLKQSAQAVVAWKKGTIMTDSITPEASYNFLLEEFKAFQENQEAFNRELLRRLEKQQEYIEHRLEERDKNLVLAIRETLETRRQIASAERKKWWQVWK